MIADSQMWDFSGDEVFFLVIASILTLFAVARYYAPLIRTSPMVSPPSRHKLLALVPLLCLSIVLIVLATASDPATVRGHEDYMTLFIVGAVPWVVFPAIFGGFFGISFRDDAIERRNTPAAIALTGAMLGFTCCYAGSNIGSGDTIWTTIVPALLSAVALFICWFLVELIARASETITIERREPAAWILGGFLTLAGVNFGWAMTGDWKSLDATMTDFFHRAWPTALLMILTIFALRRERARCSAPIQT